MLTLYTKKTEECKAVLAIGPHNSSLILFAHGLMLECDVSESSNCPDEIGLEYPEGLSYGIHVWEGEVVYRPDEDGGECEYNCKEVRLPTPEELAKIAENVSPWPELWDTEFRGGMESPEHGIKLISENENDGSALYRCNCGCVFCVECIGNAAFVCDEDDETQGGQ